MNNCAPETLPDEYVPNILPHVDTDLAEQIRDILSKNPQLARNVSEAMANVDLTAGQLNALNQLPLTGPERKTTIGLFPEKEDIEA